MLYSAARPRSSLRLLFALALALLLSGCASTSVFFPYPVQAQEFRQGINSPTIDAVLTQLQPRVQGADKQLYLMERARLQQLAGRFDASKADFEQVLAVFRAEDDRARISLTGAGTAGSSLLTNDNAIPYKGRPYERVLAHQFQALNYLALGDRDGAAVELRNAQQFQRQAELAHADDISRAQADATKNSIPLDDLEANFAGMDTVTGTLKNSFQNGYTFWLSAVFWEATGEYNDALVDYKKALELFPDNEALKADVVRANQYFSGKGKRQPDTGSVVVVFEQGFVPAKRGININIPTMDGGWFSVAFPIYTAQDYIAPASLTVRHDSTQVQTALLSDTSALAVKALKEQIPGILVRQALRARTKYEMQKKAAEQGGLGAQLFANLYNLVSEQADLRSWLTLPANAQGARLELPAGRQSLEFIGGTGSTSLPLTIRAGSTTLVRVVEANGRLTVQTFAL